MDWVSMVTLIISGGTLLLLVVQFYVNNKSRYIDRRIGVMVSEQRTKQKQLFQHVVDLLDIDRQVDYGTITPEVEKDRFHSVLNHKVSIWINLNRNNKYSTELRSNCTELATWVASAIDEPKEREHYMKAAVRNRQMIWALIDKYILEEEYLIEEMLNTKVNHSKFKIILKKNANQNQTVR